MPIPLGAAPARPSHGSGGLDGLLLDIGGDVGALVVYMEPVFAEREIEVRSASDERRTHTVAHRHASGVVAAVFVELPSGRYTLLHPGDDKPWGVVRIDGGVTAELDRRVS